jgi:HPr kinase/phosphorylase
MPLTVDRFLESFGTTLGLTLRAGNGGLSRRILSHRVQKSGLAITGEVDSVHEGRIQVLGETELSWFHRQPPERRKDLAERFFTRPMAAAVVDGGLPVPAEFQPAAEAHRVPLFTSFLSTAVFIVEAVRCLEQHFAERTTLHGVLVEIIGVGVVLQGKSGIGKSESALDLVLRGHRLVADDVIHVEKRGPETLLGRGDELTAHHMEIRGLGILNLRELFGPQAVTPAKKLELIIRVEEWEPTKEYDRLGLEDRTTAILGVEVPFLVLPVSPGRNLSTIIEVAVRNQLLKRQGIHSARVLASRQGFLAGGGEEGP